MAERGGLGGLFSATNEAGVQEEPDEGSPDSLEQADADEAENAEEVADEGTAPIAKEETAPVEPEEQESPASTETPEDEMAPDPALTNARCGGQPAGMIPFASSSATRHLRLRHMLLNQQGDEVGAEVGADANRTASATAAAAAAIDLAQVYTRLEQQEQWERSRPSPSPSSSSQPGASNSSSLPSSSRRRLLHRTIGYTMGKAGCGKELTVRVEHENDGAGPTPRKTIRPGEEELAACLQQPERCGAGSQAAGKKLPGLGALRKVPRVQLTGLLQKGKTFRTCAIVGNAGHLSSREYGKYIDDHEAVVRFNILPVAGFEKHIGAKTTLRMLNNRRSVALCCRGNFPEGRAGRADVSQTGVMIWFPEAQGEILGACKRRFPSNPRFAIPMSVNKAMAEAMRKMRSDAVRLGLGPFNQWRQMTSGAHAVLLFSQLCDRVSLYGFTTFGTTKGGPDQYAGRSERARSGTIWHDWGGEKGVWRMMYAAGAVDICSA